jgi:hypothetical protein
MWNLTPRTSEGVRGRNMKWKIIKIMLTDAAVPASFIAGLLLFFGLIVFAGFYLKTALCIAAVIVLAILMVGLWAWYDSAKDRARD